MIFHNWSVDKNHRKCPLSNFLWVFCPDWNTESCLTRTATVNICAPLHCFFLNVAHFLQLILHGPALMTYFLFCPRWGQIRTRLHYNRYVVTCVPGQWDHQCIFVIVYTCTYPCLLVIRSPETHIKTKCEQGHSDFKQLWYSIKRINMEGLSWDINLLNYFVDSYMCINMESNYIKWSLWKIASCRIKIRFNFQKTSSWNRFGSRIVNWQQLMMWIMRSWEVLDETTTLCPVKPFSPPKKERKECLLSHKGVLNIGYLMYPKMTQYSYFNVLQYFLSFSCILVCIHLIWFCSGFINTHYCDFSRCGLWDTRYTPCCCHFHTYFFKIYFSSFKSKVAGVYLVLCSSRSGSSHYNPSQ